jgi:rubrerythrin
MSGDVTSRREAIRRGAFAAGALAAAGLMRPAFAAGQSADDEDLRDFLVEAIGLEQVTVLAYATAAEEADSSDRRRLEGFRDQEQAHANALRNALDSLGFDPPEPPDSPADTGVFGDVEGLDSETANRLVDRLGEIQRAKSPAELLELLESLETDQLTYYVEQGPALDSADLATTAVEIAGCQAQHLVALGESSGRAAGGVAASVARTAAQAAPTA